MAAQLTSLRLNSLRNILEGAGNHIRDAYKSGIRVQKKENGSPLTLADLCANRFLKRELMKLLPHAGWLSEENRDDLCRLKKEWIWVVDPLDGTKEFIRRVPEFAISIGLVRDQKVVAAGVYNPISGEGGVGNRNGENEFWGFGTRPAPSNSLRSAVAAVSRSEVKEGEPLAFCPQLRLLPVGSVAYKLLRVAAGTEDITFSLQPKSEWDICGGVGLIHSVKKLYARLDGRPIEFNKPNARIPSGAVAGNRKLVTEFLKEYSKMNEAKRVVRPKPSKK